LDDPPRRGQGHDRLAVAAVAPLLEHDIQLCRPRAGSDLDHAELAALTVPVFHALDARLEVMARTRRERGDGVAAMGGAAARAQEPAVELFAVSGGPGLDDLPFQLARESDRHGAQRICSAKGSAVSTRSRP